MKKKRIALVSTDGIHVNEHFGKAERFQVYDVADSLRWVEDRSTEPLSVGQRDHPFDVHKLNRIAALLKDCTKVYVTQIGWKPAAHLKMLGIEPVIYKGTIADIK